MPLKTDPPKAKAKASKSPPPPTAKVNPDGPIAVNRQKAIGPSPRAYVRKLMKEIEASSRRIEPGKLLELIDISRDLYAFNCQQVREAAQRVHREHDLVSLIVWAHAAYFAGGWFVLHIRLVVGTQPALFLDDLEVIQRQPGNAWSWLQGEVFRLCGIAEEELHRFADAQCEGRIDNSDYAEQYSAILQFLRDHEQRDPRCVDRLLRELHEEFPTLAAELPRPPPSTAGQLPEAHRLEPVARAILEVLDAAEVLLTREKIADAVAPEASDPKTIRRHVKELLDGGLVAEPKRKGKGLEITKAGRHGLHPGNDAPR